MSANLDPDQDSDAGHVVKKFLGVILLFILITIVLSVVGVSVYNFLCNLMNETSPGACVPKHFFSLINLYFL